MKIEYPISEDPKKFTSDAADVVSVYNDALPKLYGYRATDVNGDYFVDVSDVIITYNNANNFVMLPNLKSEFIIHNSKVKHLKSPRY